MLKVEYYAFSFAIRVEKAAIFQNLAVENDASLFKSVLQTSKTLIAQLFDQQECVILHIEAWLRLQSGSGLNLLPSI